MTTSGTGSAVGWGNRFRCSYSSAGLVGVASLVLVIGTIYGCRDRFQSLEEDLGLPQQLGPSNAIFDAVHSELANPDFFFLPPLVPDPSDHPDFDAGEFNPSLSPVVEICELGGDGCYDAAGNPYGMVLTSGAELDAVALMEADEHYRVNWHTDLFNLSEDVDYRIRVLVAGTEIGFADVDVANSGRDLLNVETGQSIPLKDGRTLPIKFRIENDAVYLADPSGTLITAQDGAVTLDLPPGAIPGTDPVGITVLPASDYPSPDQLVPGTAFDFAPDGIGFSQPVMLSISYDELLAYGEDESSLRIHKLVGDQWEVVKDGWVDAEANVATVPIFGFSRYAVVQRGLQPVPPQYRLLYGRNNGADREIYIRDFSGVTQPLIDYPGAYDNYPVVSPDGHWIAFVSDVDGDQEIYISNTDGSYIRQLTHNDYSDADPRWSPDGYTVAYQSMEEGQWDIYTIAADGSGSPTSVTSHPEPDVSPSWSPDGKTIVFSSRRDGDYELYTLDARTGSVLEQLTNNDFHESRPDWSPDGNRIIFDTNRDGQREIYSLNLEFGWEIRLTEDPASDTQARWSPNGDHIAFTSGRTGDWEIFVMNSDGSFETNMTNDAGYDSRPSWGIPNLIPVVVLSLTESLSVSDGNHLNPPAVVSLNETLTVADQVSLVPPAVLSLNETLTVVDGVSVGLVLPDPSSISVRPSSVELGAAGNTAQLSATVYDASGAVIPGFPVSWASSNEAVATVNAAGLVTAVGDGQATITATAVGYGLTDSVTVTVGTEPEWPGRRRS